VSDQPLISVVMAVYNGEAHLDATLRSIAEQDREDWECVVVDDGSSDNSVDILRTWAGGDRRIRIVFQENHGLTASLMRGCREARGEFIARQDCGDLSSRDRLARQSEMLERCREVAFVSSWTEYIGPGGESLFVERGSGGQGEPSNIVESLDPFRLKAGPTHHSSVMFRRETYVSVGGYRSEFYFGQDWDLWYRLDEAGKFALVPEVLYRARWTVDGISAQRKAEQDRIVALAREATARRREGRNEGEVLQRAAAVRPEGRTKESLYRRAGGFYFVGEALRRRGDGRAREYFLRALRSHPLHLKSWARLGQSLLQGRKEG
jgi:glycosyltransferase involved in cell wall biosynthesis